MDRSRKASLRNFSDETTIKSIISRSVKGRSSRQQEERVQRPWGTASFTFKMREPNAVSISENLVQKTTSLIFAFFLSVGGIIDTL